MKRINFSFAKQTLLCFFCLCLSVAGSAQKRELTFKHITPDEGLSQFSVNSLYVDEKGYIWIGTRNGLNRYNGNDIRTFQLQKEDPASLFCNNVLRIVGDGDGRLFLLCTEGMASFDFDTQQFTTMITAKVDAIYYNEGLYLAIKDKIYRYNDVTKQPDLLLNLQRDAHEVTSILKDHSGTWWIGTNLALFSWSGTGSITENPLFSANIISIYEDGEGDKWIGTWDSGLYRIANNGEMFNYRHDSDNKNSISSNFVRCVAEDDLGNLWIGTFNGLNSYSKEAKTFSHFNTSSTHKEALTHESIWCIIKDRQGTIWMGTYFGGVNYFNPEYEIYNYYNFSKQEKKGLSSPIVGRITEDSTGNIWICTEGGGLNMYNRRKDEFRWYLPGEGNSLKGDNVKAIYYDAPKGVMWIGTHLGGLNKLDLKTGRFTQYDSTKDGRKLLPSNIVRDILPYCDKLIIGTQYGACLFDPATETATPLFADKPEYEKIKMIANMAMDAAGVLWLAVTGEGVFSYDFRADKLVNYRHSPNLKGTLSNNNVNSITLDSKGNLWFATAGSGLDLFNPGNGTFENFDVARYGLLSDCVYEVVESPQTGRLLMTTNMGFMIFDYANKQVHNYGKENGFPLIASNENALYVDKNGQVFVGGVDGMISFNENDLGLSAKPYSLYFSRLTVNGKEIRPGDDSGILTHSICYTNHLKLNAKETMFVLEFATSNYILANDEKVRYQLEGFSDDWNVARKDRSITYTNLSPGDYTLLVHAEDNNGNVIAKASLQITILPPIYRTVWAYLFYIIIVVALLWYVIVTYKSRVRLQESLKYEKKHTEDVERLNRSKLHFFTNVSHEFRTPLTLIVGQIESLLQLQSFTPTIYNKVLGVYKSSLQLKELVGELLDFRKQEEGLMKIKVSAHNLVEFLHENYLLFTEYAAIRKVDFVFKQEVDQLEVWYDTKQMQKVINNLISNALKHTPEGGKITLTVGRQGDKALIEVSDTGIGIKKEEQQKVFRHYYQVEQADKPTHEPGTGIGLSLTKGIVELHHGTIRVESDGETGTRFVVLLPLDNAHFTDDQIGRGTEDEVDAQAKLITAETLPEADWDELTPIKVMSDAKILIVEDNDGIKKMLSELFSTFYQVETASDGQEALNKITADMPHIVLSDVMMPKMSGIEMCKRIKSNPDTCHIPVVLLTARTAIKHTVEGLKIGADDYIPKPFNVNILIARCNNLVNSRRILQERFSRQPQGGVQMLATNPIDKEIMDKAMRILENHLDNTEFNVNMFAQEMGMARTNLFTKIKAITGQTPNEFILTVRLKKSAYLLRNNPELNITEIADRVGFGSARYFGKCFKDAYNLTPMSYRKGESNSEEEEETEADN